MYLPLYYYHLLTTEKQQPIFQERLSVPLTFPSGCSLSITHLLKRVHIVPHNELKQRRKKSLFISKTKINVFEIFSSGESQKDTWSEGKISKNVDFSPWGATTQTHIWNWIFFRGLAHCVPVALVRERERERCYGRAETIILQQVRSPTHYYLYISTTKKSTHTLCCWCAYNVQLLFGIGCFKWGFGWGGKKPQKCDGSVAAFVLYWAQI